MRVTLLTAFPRDPGAPRGGVEAVSVVLARSLAALPDLAIDIVTLDPTARDLESSEWLGTHVHRLPRLGRSTLTGALGADRRQVRRLLDRLAPDLVHAHDVYGLMTTGLPAPRVFTVHGFIHGDTLVSGERFAWVRSKIWRWFETTAWADQPHIISISPYVRERLGGIATGTIHDIDNPIDRSFFDVARDVRRPAVFSAATIGPRKNPIALVDALAVLAARGVECDLRLAGDVVEPEYGRRLERRIAERRLSERVALLGRLSMPEVQRELSRATAFALVSLEENSPMGIEEAMAAGVPVVTSNRCGMPYLVSEGETGYLVDPHDPEEIADRLEALITDRDLRQRMGEHGRAVALSRFHPDRVAARTRDVYLRASRRLPVRNLRH